MKRDIGNAYDTFGHREEIRNRMVLDIPGSYTESQVSHVLAERFSRNPMGWSRKGLGKLSKLRKYLYDGGKFMCRETKPKGKQEKYGEYARQYIDEQLNGAIDWSFLKRASRSRTETAGFSSF